MNQPLRALQRPLPLTEAQKSQVTAILAEFDSSRLSCDSAQRIHSAFKEAGIHGGFGMTETIEASGFDAFALRACATSAVDILL